MKKFQIVFGHGKGSDTILVNAFSAKDALHQAFAILHDSSKHASTASVTLTIL